MKDNVCYSQDKLIGCKNDSKTIYDVKDVQITII